MTVPFPIRTPNVLLKILLLLAAAWVLPVPRSAAYVRRFTPEGAPYRIDFGYTPVLRYHLSPSTSVRGVSSNEWTNVRAAFDQWQSIPETVIRFSEGAASPALTAIPIEDGRIDVHWVGPGNYSVPALGGTISLKAGQIASAWFVDDGSGVVLQAVLLINRDLDYLTDYESDSATRPFLESVVLHEIGHVLGLNHAVLGGATLWWFGGGGVGTAAGLSSDEHSFAWAQYGTPAARAARGAVAGTVFRNGSGLNGALVTAETPEGGTLAGTVSRAGGSYQLDGLPPGPVRIHVRPLDPDSPSDAYLVRGREIDVSAAAEYLTSPTDFLPASPLDRVVAAGTITTADVTVQTGTPAWRIVEIRTGLAQSDRSSADAGLVLPAGLASGWVGVYLSGTVPNGAEIRVPGTGMTVGPTQILPGALRQLTLVQALVQVTPDAPRALHAIEVTAGSTTARAPGFAKVRPREPDDNYDGLDDRFQRRYFAPFTIADAGPERDPDGDGFVNRREAAMGSNPLDAASVAYRVTDLRLEGGQVRLWVETAPGRRYQVFSTPDLGGTGAALGEPFTAGTEVTEVSRTPPPGGTALFWVRQSP